MPDLVRYQLQDGPHAGDPNTERGEIERLAREYLAADCQDCLDWTVIETRFNVVRSSVPETVTTARRLRDYLPPDSARGLWLTITFAYRGPASVGHPTRKDSRTSLGGTASRWSAGSLLDEPDSRHPPGAGATEGHIRVSEREQEPGCFYTGLQSSRQELLADRAFQT